MRPALLFLLVASSSLVYAQQPYRWASSTLVYAQQSYRCSKWRNASMHGVCTDAHRPSAFHRFRISSTVDRRYYYNLRKSLITLRLETAIDMCPINPSNRGWESCDVDNAMCACVRCKSIQCEVSYLSTKRVSRSHAR